jgi:hypothetical protein
MERLLCTFSISTLGPSMHSVFMESTTSMRQHVIDRRPPMCVAWSSLAPMGSTA